VVGTRHYSISDRCNKLKPWPIDTGAVNKRKLPIDVEWGVGIRIGGLNISFVRRKNV